MPPQTKAVTGPGVHNPKAFNPLADTSAKASATSKGVFKTITPVNVASLFTVSSGAVALALTSNPIVLMSFLSTILTLILVSWSRAQVQTALAAVVVKAQENKQLCEQQGTALTELNTQATTLKSQLATVKDQKEQQAVELKDKLATLNASIEQLKNAQQEAVELRQGLLKEVDRLTHIASNTADANEALKQDLQQKLELLQKQQELLQQCHTLIANAAHTQATAEGPSSFM